MANMGVIKKAVMQTAIEAAKAKVLAITGSMMKAEEPTQVQDSPPWEKMQR